MNRKQRMELLKEIPWVRVVRESIPCEGIKWSMVALKHLYSMGGKLPEGIPDKAHCKLRAKWHFTALKKSRAGSGNYCTHHLWSEGLHGDELEVIRLHNWCVKRDVLHVTEP